MHRIACAVATAALLGACASGGGDKPDKALGSTVQVVQQGDGAFALLRNGQPYMVKGAGTGNGDGLGGGDLALIAASGGNSIRTWGVEQLEQSVDGKPLIDRAHKLGLTVTVGLWVQHPRHGFDYTDPERIRIQRTRIRDAVVKYRDHPALLAWGLGNEMEAFSPEVSTVLIWQELNHLAGMIKELDPNHPVMTVIAETGQSKIDEIHQHYPNLDILGVNSYSGAPTVGTRLVEQGWNGPYMLTEFGVTGPWETAKTPWDAPIETDPGTKALETYTAYKLDRDNNIGRSLGSYVFFWGHKQETTATWFGMFLPTGEKLPRVDAMAYAWSGKWPDNRTPKLISLDTPVAFSSVQPGTASHAEVECVDREGDTLRYVWDIRAESTDRKIGGDAEAAPPSFATAIKQGQGTARIEFKAPNIAGAYRVFVSVFDDQGGAAVHNVPFLVE